MIKYYVRIKPVQQSTKYPRQNTKHLWNSSIQVHAASERDTFLIVTCDLLSNKEISERLWYQYNIKLKDWQYAEG